jgi:hypothetical protein
MAATDHIIIFEHANFRGHSRNIFGSEPDLNHPDDNSLDNRVSSFVVLSGAWNFFLNANFNNGYGVGPFGAGVYPTLPAGIANDTISSLTA